MLSPKQHAERSCELLTSALVKADAALSAVEDVLLAGHLAGDAVAPVLAARDRAVELKAHAERALHAQERWLGKRT